ncbi:hypothetical protein L0668_03080 [Paraglaciecola aquimarina]|uniref:ExoP galactose-binding-like domain-containing protein n=1 Tax=Paraglaciecola algarum TaxID=3050085 RepID=A0ABS9D375_9ALTE|nr:putative glycoside hydrolase [Paraglaciecola sp. G1-23]MCF2947074.1 hypothetical protein [Paraglaciecola sp. G1-23]
MKINNWKINTRFKAIFVLLCFTTLEANAEKFNPISQYLMNGKAVPNWVAYAGNSMNYFIPLENGDLATKRKSLVIEPIIENKALSGLYLKWSGKKVKNEWGGNQLGNTFFSIGRHNIDLSSVEDSAALALEIKVLRRPNENVNLSMQCNNSNKCTGEFPIKNILKSTKKDEWIQLPIPLNCFNRNGDFDFTKVTNVLSIATQGKLELEIKSIQLVAMDAGDKGCKV